MLKRSVVRLLLFAIPFGLSYWASRPARHVPAGQRVVVCAYPGDRPGELHISLNTAGCPQGDSGHEASPTVPAVRSIPDSFNAQYGPERRSIPF